MNEYLKIKWTFDDDQLAPFFIPDDMIKESYVYKSFDNPLKPKEKPKFKLNISEGVYIPGQKYYRLIYRRSLLTKGQKAECLAAMKLVQKGYNPETLTSRQKHSLQVYEECRSKITEENRLFLEYIQGVWHKYGDRVLRCHGGIYNFSWSRWKDKLDNYLYYPQFYKEIKTLSLNFEEGEANIYFNQIANLLETGVLARFNHPNFKEPCNLRLMNLQEIVDAADLNSRYPVSQDYNIMNLAEKHDFDVVISSSALKRITDYTSTSAKWLIPVVIKEVEKGGKPKKIVFIDKVLPKCTPNYHDLSNFAFKRLLKLQFCQYKAFEFPTEETPIYTEGVVEEKPELEASKRIYHNASYRIWEVSKTDLQSTLMKGKSHDVNMKLLVRSKLDACEITQNEALLPVIIRPKIEQQLQYGANICSKSELARDWTALFFRIYSNLYRARLYSPTLEIIDVEKCSQGQVELEAQTNYNYRPILGLGVLAKIMAELLTFECGQYVLQHLPKHGSFVTILKETDQSNGVYNLHAEIEQALVDTKNRQNWLPIDVNYLLPMHSAFEKIPAVFHGFDHKREGWNLDKNVKNGVFKRNRNKKKKKKNRKRPKMEFLRRPAPQNI